MLNILVSQVMLDSSGVMALVGQLVTAGMAQHVRVDWEPDASLDACSRHKLSHRRCRQRPPSFGNEYIGGITDSLAVTASKNGSQGL